MIELDATAREVAFVCGGLARSADDLRGLLYAVGILPDPDTAEGSYIHDPLDRIRWVATSAPDYVRETQVAAA